MLIPPDPPNFATPAYTPNNDLEYLEFWVQFEEYHRRMYHYAGQQTDYFQNKINQKEGK